MKLSSEFLIKRVSAFYIGKFNGHSHVEIKRMSFSEKDSSLCVWGIISETNSAWNRYGEWECQPSPSSRDNEFLERCRYTLEEAVSLVGWE